MRSPCLQALDPVLQMVTVSLRRETSAGDTARFYRRMHHAMRQAGLLMTRARGRVMLMPWRPTRQRAPADVALDWLADQPELRECSALERISLTNLVTGTWRSRAATGRAWFADPVVGRMLGGLVEQYVDQLSRIQE